MDKEFCQKCGDILPKCAIVKLPQKATINDLVNGSELTYQECLVCHKNAQIIEGQLSINENCNECYLCQLTCPLVQNEWDKSKCNILESIILKNFEKLAILIQALYPNIIVGCEVQVKGNFRTKRIDVVVMVNEKIYLIKVLANVDKVPLYSRSYEEVKEYYRKIIDKNIFTICLVPNNKKELATVFGYPVITLDELIDELEG